MTVSAGVAQYDRGETIPKLLSRCDEALYEAKASGRNKVCVSDVGPPRPEGSARVMDLRQRARR